MTTSKSLRDVDLDELNEALNAPDLDYAIDAAEDDDQQAGGCGECDCDALAADHASRQQASPDVEITSFDGRMRRHRTR